MLWLDWKTPQEVLTKEKPDISKFRIFSCSAYVCILHEVQDNRLSPKSELMIFLGWIPDCKDYLFMCHQKANVLFISLTAIFDKQYFPKCSGKKYEEQQSLRPSRQGTSASELIVYPKLGNNRDDLLP